MLKVAHPELLTYGPDVAVDGAGTRIVVGSAVNGYGYGDRFPNRPPVPAGWAWVHDADPDAAPLVAPAPAEPSTVTHCDAERPADLPDEVCCSGNAAKVEARPYCPAFTCFDADPVHTVPASDGASFVCASSNDPDCMQVPSDFEYTNTGSSVLTLETDTLRVQLALDKRLLVDGLTLENFRRYVTHAVARFEMDGDGGYAAETWVTGINGPFPGSYPDGRIEFLSYDDGTLHLNIQGPVATGGYQRSTPDFLCVTISGLTVCNTADCGYTSRDFSDGTGPSGWAEVDVVATLPLP